MTKTYYFVAYYGPNKAYSYNAEKDIFLPYSPIYRRRHTYEEAMQIMKHARHKHADKRKYIFIDSATMVINQ